MVVWLVFSCAPDRATNPVATSQVTEDSAPVESAPVIPAGDCLEDGPTGTLAAADWATWILEGTPDADAGFGYRLAVGDLDGDGGDDLVVAAAPYAPEPYMPDPYVYVVLASRLTVLAPGRYPIRDVASSTIVMEQFTSGSKYGATTTLSDAAPLIEDGALYLGSAYAEDLVYLVTWDTLEAAGNAWTHPVADVADVIFDGYVDAACTGYVPDSLQVCDPNGDGHDDLLMLNEMCTDDSPWGWLALGPFTEPRVDLDADGILIGHFDGEEGYQYQSDWGACRAAACLDYDGDGIDDITLSIVDPSSTDEAITGVWFGGREIGASGEVALGEPDVRIELGDGSYLADQTSARRESTGDWDADGDLDLLVSRFTATGASYAVPTVGYASEVSLFLGKPGFRPAGTTLTADDRYLTVTDDTEGWLGWAMSLSGDGNGDGYPELVIGDPSEEGLGRVLLRNCPVQPGPYSPETLAGAIIEGEDGTFGGVLAASGDLDGDGRDDLVVSGQADASVPGAVYIGLR